MEEGDVIIVWTTIKCLGTLIRGEDKKCNFMGVKLIWERWNGERERLNYVAIMNKISVSNILTESDGSFSEVR